MQYPPAIQPIPSSPLQEPITLQNPGTYLVVGTPGGPVSFGFYGGYMLPGLLNPNGRGITNGRVGGR